VPVQKKTLPRLLATWESSSICDGSVATCSCGESAKFMGCLVQLKIAEESQNRFDGDPHFIIQLSPILNSGRTVSGRSKCLY